MGVVCYVLLYEEIPQALANNSRDAQRAMFDRMDQDGSGCLEFNEFVDCMLTLTRKTEEFGKLCGRSGGGAGGRPGWTRT